MRDKRVERSKQHLREISSNHDLSGTMSGGRGKAESE